jgi:[phosphatase 2A protein]-leucine-carboxy methyltransferase
MATRSSSDVSDEAIQLTNNDATTFKSYAVSKGYWNDDFVGHFTRFLSSSAVRDHKAPEMSRGYYARVHGIQNVTGKFLKIHKNQCNIINIGCGYDTLYFNLFSNGNAPLKYIEIDFKQVCKFKTRIIKSNKKILDTIANPTYGDNDYEIYSDTYNLVNVDLRSLNELSTKLNKILDLPSDRPTLVISECVLIYMTTDSSNGLLKYFTDNFRKCSFINYEQFNLNDKFGQIMIENMQMRSCKLLGIESCLTRTSQADRFRKCGFPNCKIISMTDYYNNNIESTERKRIESIEFLDEIELLYQLLDHYCICYVTNYVDNDGHFESMI